MFIDNISILARQEEARDPSLYREACSSMDLGFLECECFPRLHDPFSVGFYSEFNSEPSDGPQNQLSSEPTVVACLYLIHTSTYNIMTCRESKPCIAAHVWRYNIDCVEENTIHTTEPESSRVDTRHRCDRTILPCLPRKTKRKRKDRQRKHCFRNFKTRSSGVCPGPGLKNIALGMQVPNIMVPGQWVPGCQLRLLDL